MRNKKILTALSLATLAGAVVVANIWFSQSTITLGPDRGIASAEDSMEPSKEWEQRLAAVLAKGEERLPASLRSRPSEIQQLAFGVLEGQYSLAFAHGRISEIRLIEAQSASPKNIGEVSKFFAQNKQVLLENYASIIPRMKKEKEGGLQTSSFDLLDQRSKQIAFVEVTTNEEGKLLHLKITNL